MAHVADVAEQVRLADEAEAALLAEADAKWEADYLMVTAMCQPELVKITKEAWDVATLRT